MPLTAASDPAPTPPLDPADDKRRRAIFGLVGGFLAVLVLIVAVQWVTDDAVDEPDGEPLPELSFTTLDGEPFALGDLVGQPTVINFFASWCAPCRAEMPEFEEVHQRVRDSVRFVGVNTRETDVDLAREVVDLTGVTYAILLGDDGGEGSLYRHVTDLGVMPTTAFVGADGTIVDVHAGVLTAPDLEARIGELFGR